MLVQAGPRSRVAVILNARARGVRPEVLDKLERLVPSNDLFVSSNLEHSREIARTVVERAYDGVLFGGGDGTFVQCLADIAGEARRADAELPGVGVLRLGTGNALADALGASRPTLDGLAHDLRRARTARAPRTLSLLEVDGRLTPFAGCGLDAQILDDFGKTSRFLDRVVGPSAKHLGAGARYALSCSLRSTPRFLFTRLPEIEIINTGSPAYRIDWRTGKVFDEPLPTGAVLFRGRTALATTATIPYFGLRMKMFPFVYDKPGRFQLRCSTASAYETIRNLPAVFRGEYRTPNLHDFLCDGIEMRMERPVPVQVGGDLSSGLRDRLPIALSSQPVRVLA
jgi:diacylglycerol kinase family enzyme